MFDSLVKAQRFVAMIAILLTCLVSIPVASAVEVGDQIPELRLSLLDDGSPGDTVAITSFRARLIYLDVWASWCAPCRQSMPVMNDLRAEYGPRGFEVVAVNVDETLSDAMRFLKTTPVDYPILLDPKGTLPRAFSLIAMPTSYLIDQNGTVLYQHTGFKKSDVSEIRSKIEAFLQE